MNYPKAGSLETPRLGKPYFVTVKNQDYAKYMRWMIFSLLISCTFLNVATRTYLQFVQAENASTAIAQTNSSLIRLKLPDRQLEQIKIFLYGSPDRNTFIKQLSKTNPGLKVLIWGEAHRDDSNRRLVAESMQILKSQGFTHLAIESDARNQRSLDSFMRYGDEESLAIITHGVFAGESYVRILRSARQAGLKLVAVDMKNSHIVQQGHPYLRWEPQVSNTIRDQSMADNIQEIFNAKPHAKVLFLVGSLHAMCLPIGVKIPFDAAWNEDDYPSNPVIPVGQRLKELLGDNAVVTINPIVNSDNSDLATLSSFLQRETFVPSVINNTPSKIANLYANRRYGLKYGYWDYTVFYPP